MRTRYLGILLIVLVFLQACVETQLDIILNKDGSGEVIIQQVIPNILLPGKQTMVEVPVNNLIARDKQEAQKLWGSREGVEVLNYTSEDKEVTTSKFSKMGLTGYRVANTHLKFDKISQLNLKHFKFDFFPHEADRFFVFYIEKHVFGNEIEEEYGGMGTFVASMVQDRRVTITVELPYRVVDSNAGKQNWNRATWTIPMGAIYNRVQGSLTGWAKTKGSAGISFEKIENYIAGLFNDYPWRDTALYATYFVLPVVEPREKNLTKNNTLE